MKTAIKTIPVFGTGGNYVIGEVECGKKLLVLGETKKGTVVAYMLGIIKPEHSGWLADEDEWETKVSEKDRLLCRAGAKTGSRAKGFFQDYPDKRRCLGGYRSIEKDEIKAGDVLFDRSGRCIGVYMGDGSAVMENKAGLIERKDISKAGKVKFGRPLHPDFDGDDTVYTRRIRRVKGEFAGDDVKAVQRALANLDMYSGKADGRYTLNTAKAVKRFQKERGLHADGCVGYETWDQLMGGE